MRRARLDSPHISARSRRPSGHPGDRSASAPPLQWCGVTAEPAERVAHFRVSKTRVASRIPCEESVKHNTSSIASKSRLSTVPRNTLAIGQTVRRVPRTFAPSSWDPAPCQSLSCHVDRASPSLFRRIPNELGAPLGFPVVLFLHSQQNLGVSSFPSESFSFTFVNRQWKSDGQRHVAQSRTLSDDIGMLMQRRCCHGRRRKEVLRRRLRLRLPWRQALQGLRVPPRV